MNSMAGRIPLLNGGNYGTWKAQMEAVLHKSRLLKIVIGEEKPPRIRKLPENPTNEQNREYEQGMLALQQYIDKDMDARAEILMAIETNIVTMVKNFGSSQEIWKYLQETFDRKSIRKKIECYRKLLNMKMSENQSVSEFLIDFDICVSTIMDLGIEIDEDLVVVIMLDALPERFSAIKAAIDTANEFPKVAVLKSKLLEIGDKEENDTSKNAAFKAKFNKKKNNSYYNKFKNEEGGLISWESKKQKVVATSSAEAEYVALTEATKEASYLGYILEELGFTNHIPVMIKTDSQSAQRMAEFGAHHSRTKHIHYKYHFVKDAIENDIIKLQYLSTDKMIADVLTKPLPKPKHVFCCTNFGIVNS